MSSVPRGLPTDACPAPKAVPHQPLSPGPFFFCLLNIKQSFKAGDFIFLGRSWEGFRGKLMPLYTSKCGCYFHGLGADGERAGARGAAAPGTGGQAAASRSFRQRHSVPLCFA